MSMWNLKRKDRLPDRRDTGESNNPSSKPPPIAAEAFEQYAVAIYQFAFRRLGNRQDAEDVTSQVFLKAARGLDPSFGEDARRAWLFRAARTGIADIWRSYGSSVPVPLDWIAEMPTPTRLVENDHGERVQQILAGLPIVQRRVLELRFLEGRSLVETSLELGLTEGNVKVLQHRALRRAAALELKATND